MVRNHRIATFQSRLYVYLVNFRLNQEYSGAAGKELNIELWCISNILLVFILKILENLTIQKLYKNCKGILPTLVNFP